MLAGSAGRTRGGSPERADGRARPREPAQASCEPAGPAQAAASSVAGPTCQGTHTPPGRLGDLARRAESQRNSPKYQWEARAGLPGPLECVIRVARVTAPPKEDLFPCHQLPRSLHPAPGGAGWSEPRGCSSPGAGVVREGGGPDLEKCNRAAAFWGPLQPLPSGHCADRRCVGPGSSPPPRSAASHAAAAPAKLHVGD